MAQVRTVNGAGLYRPLVTNHLILSYILIILGPICAEDFLYPTEYQVFSDQPYAFVLPDFDRISLSHWPLTS